MNSPALRLLPPQPLPPFAGLPGLRPYPQAARLLDYRDVPPPPAPPAELPELVARARSVPEVRPAAVAAARSAFRSGEVDSHVAIAAAIRALRLGR